MSSSASAAAKKQREDVELALCGQEIVIKTPQKGVRGGSYGLLQKVMDEMNKTELRRLVEIERLDRKSITELSTTSSESSSSSSSSSSSAAACSSSSSSTAPVASEDLGTRSGSAKGGAAAAPRVCKVCGLDENNHNLKHLAVWNDDDDSSGDEEKKKTKKRKITTAPLTREQRLLKTVESLGIWGKWVQPTEPQTADDLYAPAEDTGAASLTVDDCALLQDLGVVKRGTNLQRFQVDLGKLEVKMWLVPDSDDSEDEDQDQGGPDSREHDKFVRLTVQEMLDD